MKKNWKHHIAAKNVMWYKHFVKKYHGLPQNFTKSYHMTQESYFWFNNTYENEYHIFMQKQKEKPEHKCS